MLEIVEVMLSSNTQRSPSLKSLKRRKSLKARSAPIDDPPFSPFSNTISTKLRMTISASKRLNRSRTKVLTPMAMILKNSSKAKVTVNTKFRY